MALNISFSTSYLSILSFPDTKLPDFTLITGLNGSGKTHFLKALEQRHLIIEGTTDHIQIKYLDWNSMVPTNQNEFKSDTLETDKKTFTNVVWRHLQEIRQSILRDIRNSGLLKNGTWTLDSLHLLTEHQASEILNKSVLPEEAVGVIRDTLERVVESHRLDLRRRLGQSYLLDAMEVKAQKPYYLFVSQELDELIPALWGTSDIFQETFARVFVAYRDALLKNELAHLQNTKVDSSVKYLGGDEFRTINGIPPWEVLNKVMQSAGLDFIVDVPKLFSFAAYQPILKKRSTGTPVDFSNLSSGEKILMSFATCLYGAGDGRQKINFPKVLLLDEIDAPLHPSMSRSIIRAITHTLVGELGIKVIATTHSPSTVAMANEDNIYIIEANNPGVHKSSKSKAMNLLTMGVPTLSISYEGRRQVFVESQDDVVIYDLVYQASKAYLDSERSLYFLATGRKTLNGDVGNGCDQVRRLVKEFADAGNETVYGIIDWDGTNKSAGKLYVLAEDRRDGLENCILDPLLVMLALHRIEPKALSKVGLEPTSKFVTLCTASPDFWQSKVTKFESLVMDKEVDGQKSRICSYTGPMELSVSEYYLTMDDHDLEDRILAAFPQLKATQSRGGLKKYIAEHILRDAPEFIPAEFTELFSSILTA